MNRANTRFSTLRQLGFSLIELIVVTVVLGIVASMGAIVVRDGMLGYLRGREITSADWQGRLALERITRELRDIASPNYSNIAATSCNSSTFAYSDIGAVPISYTQSTTTLLRNGQPLADNVTGLRFYCLQSNGQTYSTIPSAVYYVTVSMIVATANTSATYRSTVKPRSF
ncbi:MAG: prepilin-type N-terminal cleavage/methylation domain-containing protein [Betaproteobacteria bacterium]|nr:prepilin-type N-terminal cleavage/methylation domain-containing protein [Betaproteobacteria bacterium]